MSDPLSRTHDRQELQIMSLQECLDLIDQAPLGRIAFLQGGQPIILPVNHVRQGMVVAFRTAPGSKADAATRGAKVAFEVDGHNPETQEGWSVLGVGVAVHANAILASHLERTPLEPWALGIPRNHWIAVNLQHVTGRRIGGRPDARRAPHPEELATTQNPELP